MKLVRCIALLTLTITVSLYSQEYRDTFNSVRLDFSNTMSVIGLTDIDNYEVVTDAGDTLEISAIWLPNDSVYTKVAVIMEQISWTVKNFTVKCYNLKDLKDSTINLEKNFANVSFRNNITKPIVNIVAAGSVKKLIIVDAIASKISQPEHIPAHVYDNDTSTIWTAEPIPQWIIVELSRTSIINRIDIAFTYWFQPRIYTYDIYSSIGGDLWTPVLTATSTSLNQWSKHIFDPIEVRYIRIVTVGNSQSLWANIKEIEIYGY